MLTKLFMIDILCLHFIISVQQRVQNCLARVMTRSPRFTPSKPLLKSLHWLPVQYRIMFKMCTISYQALYSKQPSYLHTLLTPIRKPIQLRSSTSDLLFVPKVNTNMGTRAFAVGAPTLWNMLPSSVKSVENIAKFRRHLKTSVQSGLSTIAPWRINQSDDNLICLPTMRSINPFCFDAPLSLVSKDIGAIEVN